MERDLLSIDDLSPRELAQVLELSAKVKAQPGDYADRLTGRSVALIFEKPSTRTRVSFEVAIASAGGHPVPLSSSELQLGRGETIEDTGRVLSRYVDAIVLRTFEQERLEVLAAAASVPVVNALSDFEHPCQCLADLLTIRERQGRARGPDARLPRRRQQRGALAAARRREVRDARAGGDPARVRADPAGRPARRRRSPPRPAGASRHARPDRGRRAAPTSCTPTSGRRMGQEAEADERALVFPALPARRGRRWTVAAPDVIVLHCLPAHRGQEITDEVIDGPHSVVWDQAENRLHTQKALLLWLLGVA